MIISVQGNLIDTRNIYLITEVKEIKERDFHFEFTIKFFNEKDITIGLGMGVFSDYPIDWPYNHIEKAFGFIYSSGREKVTMEEIREFCSSKECEDARQRILEMRDSVVRVWSDNQTEISVFEL